MAKNGSHGEALRGRDRSHDRVLQEPRPNPLARPVLVDSQAPQYDHRNRVWHVASNTGRGVFMSNGTGTQAVVTHILAVRCHNIGARGSLRLVLASTILEPAFKAGFGTAKRLEDVIRGEGRGSSEMTNVYRSQGALVDSNLTRRSRFASGLSRISANCLKRPSSRAKKVLSSRTCSAFSHAASS